MRVRLRGLFAAHPVVFFVLGVLFAGQLPGEPLHSRLALAVLVVVALVAGLMWEGARGGGAAGDLTSADRQLLEGLLGYVADHGGGHGPFAGCDVGSCVSCQATHLLAAVSGADR